jgi:hypothetical protein
MKTLNKVTFIFLFFIISISPAFSQDKPEETKPADETAAAETTTAQQPAAEEAKKKQEVKTSFTVSESLEIHSLGLEFAGTDIGSFEDAVFSRTSAKGTIALPFGDLYNLSFWIRDDVDNRLNPVSKVDPDDATEEYPEDPINWRFRNRFYVGINNMFSIKDIMNVGLNFDFRVESDMKATRTNFNTTMRLNPQLYLGGKYDFGLSWSAVHFFGMHMDKDLSTAIDIFDFEAFYNVTYEFMHHVEGTDAKGWIFANNELLMYVNKLATADAGIVYFDDLFKTGFKFDIQKIQPTFGAALWIDQEKDSTATPTTWFETNAGFFLGLGYTKGMATFSAEYLAGMQATNVTGDNPWQSRFNTKITLKF